MLRPSSHPAHCELAIGRRGSLAGLSEWDMGTIVNPASFLGAGDWEKGALLELSIMLLFVRLASSAAADVAAAGACDALHTNRDIREQDN